MTDSSDIYVEYTDVLVIGASMVGMTLTALLGKYGIRECIAVEKHSTTAIHPRAALFHRTSRLITIFLNVFCEAEA
jgi:2-polyprenyl-6-methoxyphenol hydroxylase-like FAD-dependent oxidoreductase